MSRSSEQANISQHIVEMAQISPYQKAMICLSGRDTNGKMAYSHLTYRQFNQRSSDLARGLQQAGIVRGTRTALQMIPELDWFCIAYALLKIGAVPVLLQPSMGAQRISYCIKAVEPEALIIDPELQKFQRFQSAKYPSVHLQISTKRRWFSKGISIADLQQNDPTSIQLAEMRNNDTGMILFSTSCETDTPKPTILTHGMMSSTLELMKSVLAMSTDSVLFTTFPLFMLLAPALGIRHIIPPTHTLKANKLNPKFLVESIWDHGITHLLMSPTRLMLLTQFLKDEAIFLPSIQRMGAWGENYPAHELQRIHYYINNETQIFPLYGMTEAPIVSTLGSHKIISETQIKTERGFGICQGKAVDGIDMRIIEVSDRPIDNWSDDLLISNGGIGELVIRGDSVSKQYYSSITDDAINKIPDGQTIWHRTGDIGWLDSASNFWFCGRKQDRIIISEEETLYTIPCEAVFMQHERVYRCIIAGVGPIPHQIPVLIIELAPGDSGKYISSLTHELTELAQTYPHTGNIKHILFRKSFPVHPLFHQKVNRKQLTIWAAKKLGKTLPDTSDPESSDHIQAAIYPPTLEEDAMSLSAEPQLSETEQSGSLPETSITVETVSDTQTDQVEQPDSSIPGDSNDKPKFMNKVKTFFGKMIPNPDIDDDDSINIEELPQAAYITAEQFDAISEAHGKQTAPDENETRIKTDFQPSFDSASVKPITQADTDKRG